MRIRKTDSPKALPLFIRTVTFTQTEQALLDRMSQDVSDTLGRKVSGSALLRALVRYAASQPYAWLLDQLRPQVEQEMSSGRRWGSKKQ
jgi:hypothetical protein